MFFDYRERRLKYLYFLLFAGCFSTQCFALSDEVRVASDIAYGRHELQKFDVYYPRHAENAPVIFMVHGGAWRIGDKASKAVFKNKVKRWVAKGFVFISVNYRLLPQADPVTQSKDVRRALVYAQHNIHTWGGGVSKFILMGHSSGAHLVSLLSSSPVTGLKSKRERWLGTVAIDSAAYDVEAIMNAADRKRFYKKAFGDNPAYWQQGSPYFLLSENIPPFLAVCSAKRKDGACQQAGEFINKAKLLGSRAEVLEVDLSHRRINVELGEANEYTEAVEAFMRSLDPGIAALLDRDGH